MTDSYGISSIISPLGNHSLPDKTCHFNALRLKSRPAMGHKRYAICMLQNCFLQSIRFCDVLPADRHWPARLILTVVLRVLSIILAVLVKLRPPGIVAILAGSHNMRRLIFTRVLPSCGVLEKSAPPARG